MFTWAQLIAMFKNVESERELKPCYLSMIFYQVAGTDANSTLLSNN
jgi:hypothetical protein